MDIEVEENDGGKRENWERRGKRGREAQVYYLLAVLRLSQLLSCLARFTKPPLYVRHRGGH